MIKKITPFLVGLGIFIGLFYLLSQPPKDNSQDSSNQNNSPDITQPTGQNIYKDFPVYDNPDLVFYFGIGCPHCENVEKWLDENNQDKKIKVNYKEVYYDKDNQTALYNTAKEYCPEIIENGNIGVPTGFDPASNKCIQGDTPIIDFLSSKLGQ